MRTLFILACLVFIPASVLFHQIVKADAVGQAARVDRATNNVIVFRVDSGAERRTVTVPKPHGMMLRRKETSENFYLFDNVKKRMSIIVDYDLSLKTVDHLPGDAVIEHPDVCTVPLDAGMPSSAREPLRTVLARKEKSDFRNEAVIYCTRTRRMRFIDEE